MSNNKQQVTVTSKTTSKIKWTDWLQRYQYDYDDFYFDAEELESALRKYKKVRCVLIFEDERKGKKNVKGSGRAL